MLANLMLFIFLLGGELYLQTRINEPIESKLGGLSIDNQFLGDNLGQVEKVTATVRLNNFLN